MQPTVMLVGLICPGASDQHTNGKELAISGEVAFFRWNRNFYSYNHFGVNFLVHKIPQRRGMILLMRWGNGSLRSVAFANRLEKSCGVKILLDKILQKPVGVVVVYPPLKLTT